MGIILASFYSYLMAHQLRKRVVFPEEKLNNWIKKMKEKIYFFETMFLLLMLDESLL